MAPEWYVGRHIRRPNHRVPMKWSVRRSPILSTLVAASVWLVCAGALAQEWRLLGRHGERASISSLKRKLQDLPDVKTPNEFSAYLESKRLKFTRQVHRAGTSGAIEFQVPDAGLAILFVNRQQCGQDGPVVR